MIKNKIFIGHSFIASPYHFFHVYHIRITTFISPNKYLKTIILYSVPKFLINHQISNIWGFIIVFIPANKFIGSRLWSLSPRHNYSMPIDLMCESDCIPNYLKDATLWILTLYPCILPFYEQNPNNAARILVSKSQIKIKGVQTVMGCESYWCVDLKSRMLPHMSWRRPTKT